MSSVYRCVVPNCARPRISRGLCRYHYDSALRDGILESFPRTVGRAIVHDEPDRSPTECLCPTPLRPDQWHECQRCHMPVVALFTKRCLARVDGRRCGVPLPETDLSFRCPEHSRNFSP